MKRAMAAAKLANMPPHRPGNKSANLQTSQSDAASMLNVSTRAVASAKKVETDAIPEVVAAVESGKLPVSAATTIVDATPDKQREVIAKDDKKAILAASKEIRKEMAEQRRAKRTEQIVEAVQNSKPIDGSLGTFAVIYADPLSRYRDNGS
jgi:hypothetical protein